MNQRGFTLIELLVAVIMIGVLSTVGILILNPIEQIKRGRDAQRKYDLSQLPITMEGYFSDFKRYPEEEDGHIKDAPWGNSWQGYLAILPKDPLSPKQDYNYEVGRDGDWYRLCAKLERCSDPQINEGINCNTAQYNYSVASSNMSVTACSTPTPTPEPRIFLGDFEQSAWPNERECTAWNNWRTSLADTTYRKITLKSATDISGVSCEGSTANTLCQNLKAGREMVSTGCDGRDWSVSICDTPSSRWFEVSTSGSCTCPQTEGYVAKLCTSNGDWGDVNTPNCGAPSQRIDVVCE